METLWILIRLLLQMSADLDLHYYSIDDIDKGKVTLVMLYIFYARHSSPIFYPVNLQHSRCFNAERKTMLILISSLCQNPADLDGQCFQ